MQPQSPRASPVRRPQPCPCRAPPHSTRPCAPRLHPRTPAQMHKRWSVFSPQKLTATHAGSLLLHPESYPKPYT